MLLDGAQPSCICQGVIDKCRTCMFDQPITCSHFHLLNSFYYSLARDVISGAIMAATSVPQLIAYAETTGYAGYRGLTTAGPP